MGGLSTYLKNKLQDAALGGGYTKPGTVYVALYTATPNADGGGTEVTGGSYARAAVTNNSTNWPNATAGVKENGAIITFAAATDAWGTVTHWGIFDALTSGNLLWWGTLGSSVAPVTGSVVKFGVSQFSFTIS
jgi:hypothetical protein